MIHARASRVDTVRKRITSTMCPCQWQCWPTPGSVRACKVAHERLSTCVFNLLGFFSFVGGFAFESHFISISIEMRTSDCLATSSEKLTKFMAKRINVATENDKYLWMLCADALPLNHLQKCTFYPCRVLHSAHSYALFGGQGKRTGAASVRDA